MSGVKIDKSLCDERTSNIISSLNEIKFSLREVRDEARKDNETAQATIHKLMTNDLVHIDARLISLEGSMGLLGKHLTVVNDQVKANNANKKMLLSIIGNIIVITLMLLQYFISRGV